jgi:hypothetical protein
VLDARFGAIGGVGVPADLHLQDLQVRPVAGLEQVIQDLLLLGGRVIGQQITNYHYQTNIDKKSLNSSYAAGALRAGAATAYRVCRVQR